MGKEEILGILRGHASELQAAGVLHLRLFGSVARGEATAASDVDLIADFDVTKRLTLFSLGGLESRLTEIVGAPVELCASEWMRPQIRERACREAVVVF